MNKTWEIDVAEIAYSVYTIEAETALEAINKFTDGDVEQWRWRDLGHDSPEIIEVREVEQ